MDTKAIREALEKASPGPWLQTGRFTVESETNLVSMTKNSNDAHLIANAPEWLHQLLVENERLQAEQISSAVHNKLLIQKLGHLKADKAAAVEALDDIATYPPFDETNNGDRFYEQMREKAREALEQLDERPKVSGSTE